MSFRLAVKALSMTGEVAINARLGSNAVLTAQEGIVSVDSLLRAGHRCLALEKSELVDAVRILCLALMIVKCRGTMRPGQDKDGLKASSGANPRVSICGSRIFEANRVKTDDEGRMRMFYIV